MIRISDNNRILPMPIPTFTVTNKSTSAALLPVQLRYRWEVSPSK